MTPCYPENENAIMLVYCKGTVEIGNDTRIHTFFLKVRSLFYEIYESITKFPSPLTLPYDISQICIQTEETKGYIHKRSLIKRKTIYVKLLWFHPFL